MTYRYSLAHLSAQRLPPVQLIEVAANAGYDHVGLRLLAPAPGIPAYPLMDDPAAMRDTLARLRDTGLSVWDIEIVRLNPDFRAAAFLPFLEVGARLGARAILVVAGDDRDTARLAQSYAEFCAAAQDFGLSANLEFTPWTAVPDAAAAVAMLRAAGTPANARILVDAIHVERSATTLDEVAALPVEWQNYAQFCDAPAGIPEDPAEILRQARYQRLLPGEGGIDLQGLLHALPQDIVLALETWDEQRTPALGYAEWATRALQSLKALTGNPALAGVSPVIQEEKHD